MAASTEREDRLCVMKRQDDAVDLPASLDMDLIAGEIERGMSIRLPVCLSM